MMRWNTAHSTRAAVMAATAALVVALACAAAARGDDKVRPLEIEVAANFHAASVYATYDGDDDGDATVVMEYRAGDGPWRTGHPLDKTGRSKTFPDHGRFAGSIFDLKPDEALEVRVTFSDPDGVTDEGRGARDEGTAPAGVLSARSRTRSDVFAAGTGRALFVGPNGDDAAAGSREAPWATIQRAVDAAEPGDVITILAGTYFQNTTIRRSGKADAYITLRGEGAGHGKAGNAEGAESAESAEKDKDAGLRNGNGTATATLPHGRGSDNGTATAKDPSPPAPLPQGARGDGDAPSRSRLGHGNGNADAPSRSRLGHGNGNADAPSRSRLGQDAPRAVITGAVTVEGGWEDSGGGVWRLAEKRRTGTVTLGGKRIYHHGSIDELRGAKPPLVPGWQQDEKAGRVFVRTADGAAPAAGAVRLGTISCGITVEKASHWIIEDLAFDTFGGGPYSRGMDVVESTDVVVRRCAFSTMRTSVSIRKMSARCLVDRCTFTDSGIWDWPWKAVKAHDTEGSAVSLGGAGGNVVRHCRAEGLFNGITPATWSALEDESLNRDMDIHDNTFYHMGDDPLEPEGACMNVRFWNNRTLETLQGISIAPITVGPAYVVRDRYVNFKQGALKVGVDTRGVVHVYHVLGIRGGETGDAFAVVGDWDNIHFRNCIFAAGQYAVEDTREEHPRGCTFDYCNLWAARGTPVLKWEGERYRTAADLPAAEGFGPHNLSVKPYARVAEDGRAEGLAEELIDAGVVIPGVNDGFKGKGPDIGPEEVR
jgi:hypothetical protein